MVKLGLISKHIVLSEPMNKSTCYPLMGIVLIEDEYIHDVVIFDSDTLIENVMAEYAEWAPVDYSDFYLSPGIIDINTRMEWDSYEVLTGQAVKGGVTLTYVEQGYYQPVQFPNTLHCDVAQIQRVHDTTDFSSISPNVHALKAYLYPPGPDIKSIADLQSIMKKSYNTGMPFLIDPTMPDPRMLYMASPLRLESIQDRENGEIANTGSNIFAAAFPEATGEGSSPESDFSESEEIDISLFKTNSLKMGEIKPIFIHKKAISHEKIEDLILTPEIFVTEEELENEISPYMPIGASTKRKGSHDIYQDLDNRIKLSSQSIENLVQAEKYTYSLSGSTSFLSIDVPKKAASMSEFNSAAIMISPLKSPSPQTDFHHSTTLPQQSAKRPFRPQPIQTNTVVKPDVSQDYNYFLANYPEYWESSGVEKVLESALSGQSLHFTNISSAAAVNRVRQSARTNSGLSCEISAPHLCFTSGGISAGNTRFKNNPPIRNQGNCNLLWDLLKMKGIDCICSQHASIHPTMKKPGSFQQALNGISAIGCSLQAIWNMLNIPVSTQEQLEHYIVRLAKWFSLHPAKIMKADKERGSIAKGKFADIMVWRPYEKYFLSDYSYAENSPFINQEFMGKIDAVYIRGKLAFDQNGIYAAGMQLHRKNNST